MAKLKSSYYLIHLNSFVGRRIVKEFKRSENLQSHLRGQLENASTLEIERTDLLISKLTIA